VQQIAVRQHGPFGWRLCPSVDEDGTSDSRRLGNPFCRAAPMECQPANPRPSRTSAADAASSASEVLRQGRLRHQQINPLSCKMKWTSSGLRKLLIGTTTPRPGECRTAPARIRAILQPDAHAVAGPHTELLAQVPGHAHGLVPQPIIVERWSPQKSACFRNIGRRRPRMRLPDSPRRYTGIQQSSSVFSPRPRRHTGAAFTPLPLSDTVRRRTSRRRWRGMLKRSATRGRAPSPTTSACRASRRKSAFCFSRRPISL